MKKISLVLSATCLLIGSSLSPVAATSHTTKSVSMLAFDNPPARQQGKADALAWYNATNPTAADLDAQYEMARENRLAAEAGSDEYYYWTGYQFQVDYFR
jgi:hypothetical protein